MRLANDEKEGKKGNLGVRLEVRNPGLPSGLSIPGSLPTVSAIGGIS